MKEPVARASGAKRKRAAEPRGRKWSRQVAERRDALDLQRGVFTKSDPKENRRLAQALGRAQQTPQGGSLSLGALDADPLINRAGSNLPARRKKKLTRAEAELRRQFGRA